MTAVPVMTAIALALMAPPVAGEAVPQLPANWSAADRYDATCAVLIAMAGDEISKTPGVPAGASQFSIFYFIGKIKGRHPDVSMRTVLDPKYVASLAEDLGDAPAKCGGELQAIGGELQAAGQILAAEGQSK